MQVSVVDSKIDSVETDLLILGVFAEDASEEVKLLDAKLDGAISALLSSQFECENQQFRTISTLTKLPVKTILLIGLGKKEEATLETLRKSSGIGVKTARDMCGITKFSIALHLADVPKTSLEDRSQAVAEGAILGAYQFTKYKTVDKDKIKVISDISFVGANEASINKGVILAESENIVRDLANEPASNLKPVDLANFAESLSGNGVKVTVFDKKKIEELGMTALLAVNRGSVHEPRFVIMEYNGGGKEKVALIGKGITFDSGGLGIKPSDGMLTMKHDMCGAAVVIGTMRAAALLKLPVNLTCVFAATENMLGQDAYKPGDFIPTYSGKTIEIAHTDAEGRVILSDALSYTEKVLKPAAMIDLATLTGACVVALGSVCSGVMGDQKIIDTLLKSGEATGERVWQLPFFQEYHDQVKSEVADVRNLGNIKKEGGAITAGAFLAAFVDDTPWAHIDIAGTSWSDLPELGYSKKGGTGYGVRLLIHALENWNG